MDRLRLIRFAVLILIRDLIIPGAGVYLAVRGLSVGTLELWHLPLIAGMLGTPLVARGENPPELPPEPPAPAAAEEGTGSADTREQIGQ